MRPIKKRFFLLKAVFTLFLVISISTLIPTVCSQPGKTIISKIATQKELMGSLTQSTKETNIQNKDIQTQGLFDFIIMILTFIINLIQRLINFISNAIQLVMLLERIIDAVETLINLINQLIQAISDIFNPDELSVL